MEGVTAETSITINFLLIGCPLTYGIDLNADLVKRSAWKGDQGRTGACTWNVGIDVGPAVNDVTPPVPNQHVVAFPASQRVIAGAAEQLGRTGSGSQFIIAIAAVSEQRQGNAVVRDSPVITVTQVNFDVLDTLDADDPTPGGL